MGQWSDAVPKKVICMLLLLLSTSSAKSSGAGLAHTWSWGGGGCCDCRDDRHPGGACRWWTGLVADVAADAARWIEGVNSPVLFATQACSCMQARAQAAAPNKCRRWTRRRAHLCKHASSDGTHGSDVQELCAGEPAVHPRMKAACERAPSRRLAAEWSGFQPPRLKRVDCSNS